MSGSQKPAAPASRPVNYTVDAGAFVPGGGGALDCNPSDLQTSSTSINTNLTVTPGTNVSAATLAFSGCQVDCISRADGNFKTLAFQSETRTSQRDCGGSRNTRSASRVSRVWIVDSTSRRAHNRFSLPLQPWAFTKAVISGHLQICLGGA